jgi:hypothetical protein
VQVLVWLHDIQQNDNCYAVSFVLRVMLNVIMSVVMLSVIMLIVKVLAGLHDIKNIDILHDGIQHNDVQHYSKQNVTLSIMCLYAELCCYAVMQSVICAERHLCWVSFWLSLCWVSFWLSLCWVSFWFFTIKARFWQYYSKLNMRKSHFSMSF